MKEKLLFVLAFIIFTLSTLVSIAPTKNDLARMQIEKKLTIDEIKKGYEGRPIKNITQFKDNYVLVEWQKPTLANRFDLYNLETGEKDILPTAPYYVSLPEIVNEYRFVFLADGRNHISSHRDFPFLIECRMDRIEPIYGTRFSYKYKPMYFSLAHEVEFGFLKNQIISEIAIRPNNIKITS